MSTTWIIFGIIGFVGLIQAIIQKPLFVGTGQYTEESKKVYARANGIRAVIMSVIVAVTLYFLEGALAGKVPAIIEIVLGLLSLISIIATARTHKILEKK